MPKAIYQVHLKMEASENSDNTELIRTHRYVIANSVTEAKLKAYGGVIEEDDEVYALRVCEQTLKDEITHCKEIIAYWSGNSERVKENDYRYVDIIKLHQKKYIEIYGKLLKELKDD